MEYAIGIALALVVAGFGRAAGFDRDRAFYSTVAVVVASYYLLFAVIGGSSHVLAIESLFAVVFVVAAVAGFKASIWLVAACLAGHGVFDVLHDSVVVNPGVPEWWPGFCLAYDVTAAAGLAGIELIARRRQRFPMRGSGWRSKRLIS